MVLSSWSPHKCRYPLFVYRCLKLPGKSPNIKPSIWRRIILPNPGMHQGKNLSVDQACADCSGFLVPGTGGAPPPKLHPGTSDCVPELAFAFMALRANSWICCPPASLPPAQKKRDAQHKLCSTRGHTPNVGQKSA